MDWVIAVFIAGSAFRLGCLFTDLVIAVSGAAGERVGRYLADKRNS
jgi:hypothetical protein